MSTKYDCDCVILVKSGPVRRQCEEDERIIEVLSTPGVIKTQALSLLNNTWESWLHFVDTNGNKSRKVN